jgi:predicted transcriptional regulator YdeE
MTADRLTPEIVTASERNVVGTARHYTMDTRGEIGAQWQDFFDKGYDVQGALPGAMFGVSFSSDGKGGFRYAVAVEVETVPAPDEMQDGLCAVTLSAGDYAVLRHFGQISALPGYHDRMFTEWLPASDHVVRAGAVFEVYPEDARNGPAGMAYEIWVPVTAKN